MTSVRIKEGAGKRKTMTTTTTTTMNTTTKKRGVRGGSVLARWLSNRKVAGSILLVVAFSRLWGFRVFNRVNTARPALSGGVRLSELRGHSFPWVTELEQGWPSCFSP